MFSPFQHTQFCAVKFLETLWTSQKDLAGYSQQDAHEFYICLLNQMHMSAGGVHHGPCHCIIHKIFSGMLKSDVTCGTCQNQTSVSEAMFDLSLEIPNETAGQLSLHGCLERYVVY